MKKFTFSFKALLVLTMALSTSVLFAQNQNCALPSGSGGTLSMPASSSVCPGTSSPAITLTGNTSGLSTTEYIFTNPNDITTNAGPNNGPRFLGANSTGIIDPLDFDLMEGDDFCVTAFSYNKEAMQAFLEELLTGETGFGSCCFFAELTTGTDVCGLYNEAGIFAGSDLQDMNDVANFMEVFGSQVCLEAVYNLFDSLNEQVGQPLCVDGLPVCFAASNTVCYEVACAPSACGPTTAVEGLVAVPNPAGTGANLSWAALPGADFYQAKGRRVGTTPFGQFVTANTSKNVGGLNPGTSYEWYVRARCGVDGPLSMFSPFNTFTTNVPVSAKIAEESPVFELYPNPATDQVSINMASFIDEESNIFITDLSGRLISSQQLNEINFGSSINLDISGIANGTYLVEVRSENRKHTQKLIINR